MLQRQSCRQQRAAHRQPSALNQRPSGGQADAALFWTAERVRAEGLVVVALVDPFQITSGHAEGLMNLVLLNQISVQQQLMQHAELGHREAMAGWQGSGVTGVVDNRDRHVAPVSRCPKQGSLAII